MLSGASLLACGCTVLGRPLSTQQQKRDLIPFTTYDITSTFFSDANAPGTHLAKPEDPINFNTYSEIAAGPVTSPDFKTESQNSFATLDTPLKNPLTNTDTKSDVDPLIASNSGTQPDPSSEIASTIPSSLNAPDTSRFISSDTSVANTVLSWGASAEKTPWFPNGFRTSVQDMKDHKCRYRLFELSEDKGGFEVKAGPDQTPVCGAENESWGDFMKQFDQCHTGFALYRKDDATVLSLMNMRHECGTQDASGHWEKGLYCQDEVILMSFKTAWIQNVSLDFRHVESFDSIRRQSDLVGICKENLIGRTPLKSSNSRECVD